jgi:hypothetical protein
LAGIHILLRHPKYHQFWTTQKGADQFSIETADHARAFALRRADVPIQRSCVPDSLALMRLLWRKGLDADLYFGVRLDPFAAHCWVQAEDYLLSDPLANVLSFSPVFRL